MRKQTLKRQAVLTAGNNAAVRALGFFMRLWVSRALGAEAVGIMELASGAHMLALTPAAAGLPAAVSRLTAREKDPLRQRQILRAGRQTALGMGGALTALFFLLSPGIASLLGDERTLPSLILFSPCVLLVGVSSVYDGFCFGVGSALPPAVSELTEQAVRLGVTMGLLRLLPGLTPAYRAALPAFATTLGEAAGGIVILLMVGKSPACREKEALGPLRARLRRMALPIMITRLSHTGLRALCGVIIPLRLVASGLEHSEAMSRLGMLNGMVMPLMMLPGMLSGALATVGTPAAARCADRRARGRLALRLILPALAAGAACGGAVYLLAPFLAMKLYRLPELSPLLRAMCPMAVLLPVQQVISGLMTGLGMQKKALNAALLGAGVNLLCTWLWAAQPQMRIFGAGYAALAGHGLTMLLCFAYLSGKPGRKFFRAQ